MPTQTAVDTDGVYPTIQASLFWPVQRGVLHGAGLAGDRPPAAGAIPAEGATWSIASVTLRATGWGTACCPAGAVVVE